MIGCLLIHGFTGSPLEVEPISARLRETTDWLISVPTLPGHGDGESLQGISHREWLTTAESAFFELQQQCGKIYVVGFSMGGVIAGYLAANYKVDRLVLLSAAAFYINPKEMLADVKQFVHDGLRGKLADNELFNRYKTKTGATPLSATIEFQRLVHKLRPSLKSITVPTLILQGEKDGLVPKRSARFLYDNIKCDDKELLFLPESKHIICHDVEREQVVEQVTRFLTC